MEELQTGWAIGNASVQIIVLAVALNLYYNAKYVRVVVTISIAALALSMSGLVLATVPADVLMAVGVWILYAAIGVGVIVAVVIGLRSGGATRFRWHTSRYAQWRKAHPMPSYDDLQEV